LGFFYARNNSSYSETQSGEVQMNRWVPMTEDDVDWVNGKMPPPPTK
jgi:hypothetical protein